jgi:hypothetical protein
MCLDFLIKYNFSLFDPLFILFDLFFYLLYLINHYNYFNIFIHLFFTAISANIDTIYPNLNLYLLLIKIRDRSKRIFLHENLYIFKFDFQVVQFNHIKYNNNIGIRK